MPEIWMPYGGAEVVINIKAENLSDAYDVNDKAMDEEQLLSILRQVDRPSAVLTDGTNTSRALLDRLNHVWGESTGFLNVVELKGANSDQLEAARGEPHAELGIVDGVLIRAPQSLVDAKPLVISTCVFDPVYGFTGPETVLTRLVGAENDAVKRWDRKVAPGADTDPAWFALKVADCFAGLKALTVVPTAGGAAMVSYADIRASAEGARGYLRTSRRREVKPSRLTLLGCGGSDYDSTLASALRTAGNHLGIVSEDAEVILVAECADGLGSAALRNAVEGTPGGRQGISVEEQVLNDLRERGNLHIVSTLPRSLVEKRLKITAHSSLREAFESVESRHSWRLKANVIARGPLLGSYAQQEQPPS